MRRFDTRKMGMRMYGQRCLFLHFVSIKVRTSWEKMGREQAVPDRNRGVCHDIYFCLVLS